MRPAATRGRTPPFLRAAASVVLVLVVATACSADVLPEPVTEQGEETTSRWDTFVPIAAVVWAVVWGLVGWVIVRYRRRSDDLPDQRQDFPALELTLVALPLVIVAFLWFTSWQAQDEITSLSDDPDLEVEVVGFQWQWQFRYQEGDEVPTAFDVDANSDPSMEPPEMVLPVGSTVHLHLVANDVIHSFWVPEFLEKRDLVPEIDNTIEVVVTEEGEWTGRCAEFCGLNHWQMYFSVRAVPLDEFRAWVADTDASSGGEATS